MEVEYIEYLASNSVADKKINLTSLHIHAFFRSLEMFSDQRHDKDLKTY